MSRRRILLIGCILLGMAIVAYVFRDVIAQWFLVPLLYLVRIAEAVYHLFPQYLYWLALLLFAIFLAVNSLSRQTTISEKQKLEANEYLGRVGMWSHWFEQQEKGNYFGWIMAHNLAELTLDVLSHRYKLPRQELKHQIEKGEMDLPPDVLDYLQAGLDTRFFLRHPEPRLRLPFQKHRRIMDMNPQPLVNFLEKEMGD